MRARASSDAVWITTRRELTASDDRSATAARAAWPDGAPSHPTAEELRLERRVVVAGHRLAERDVLVTPQDPDGVAFVCGIPVGKLLDRLRGGGADLPPPALQWLRSRGLCDEGPNSDLPNPSVTAITRVRDTA